MRHVCPQCGEFMRVDRQGVTVVELADFGPYKLWMADLLACSNGHKVISGFAAHPFAEHYEPSFVAEMQRLHDTKKEGVDLFYAR